MTSPVSDRVNAPIGELVLTPPLTQGMWRYHVQVSADEAIVGVSEDNTTYVTALHPPVTGSGSASAVYGDVKAEYTLPTEDILEEIRVDLRPTADVTDADYLAAITLIQERAGQDWRTLEPTPRE